MRDLNPESALAIIRDILKNTTQGTLAFTKHARKQMALRGYTTQDVIYILETGQVDEIVLQPNGECYCKVKGYDLDGDIGAVITAIINENSLLVITVLGGT